MSPEILFATPMRPTCAPAHSALAHRSQTSVSRSLAFTPTNGKKTLDTLSKCLYFFGIHVLQFNRLGLWASVLDTVSGKQVLRIHSHRPVAKIKGNRTNLPWVGALLCR